MVAKWIPPWEAPRPPAGHAARLAVRWSQDRLWIGPFAVPDHPFLLHPPCRACGGPVFHDEGSFRCLLCAREHVVAAVRASQHGVRVVGLGLAAPPAAPPIRELPLAHRNGRAQSRREGLNGFLARVLKQVPGPPGYTVVETLTTKLAVPRSQVRRALEQLEAQGLVTAFSFAGGYRQGWRRVAPDGPAEES